MRVWLHGVFLYQKKKKKNNNNPNMKIHFEAANLRPKKCYKFSKTETFFFLLPKIVTFVVLPRICMHGTGANNITETAEHKQQQPHNEAVNKEDASPSLCIPAN